MRHTVLIDGEDGAYGVAFPDLPGCAAMGKTIDEALGNAVDAARDRVEVVERRGGAVPAPTPIEKLRFLPEVAEALADGAAPSSITLLRADARSVKANLSLSAGALSAFDEEAGRRGVTRSAFVEAPARRAAAGTPVNLPGCGALPSGPIRAGPNLEVRGVSG